jgi:hypothetical protein
MLIPIANIESMNLHLAEISSPSAALCPRVVPNGKRLGLSTRQQAFRAHLGQ